MVILDGMLYPGQQRSAVVPNLFRDQHRIGAVVAVGNTCLLVGATLAWLGRQPSCHTAVAPDR